ncbi:MAG: cytochrome c bioproteinis protein [Spirochaetes bacterium]|nr:MAG: cytochrome c bioproteinis protein [Spirochaetota bacterium]
MREFWKKLKSIKLAITLIVILTVGSLLATLIPQGKAAEEYFKLYPKIVAELVVQSGLGRYFSSLLFFIPALAFFFNLGACTVDRLARELRKKQKRRHGPDILHIGLLVLIIGSLVSFSAREEGMVRLVPGESVELPAGEILRLIKFTDERYEDGRPKDWTSIVSLEKDGVVFKEDVPIRVNKPLRIGGITLYQNSYASTLGVAVASPDGKVVNLARGESFEDGDVRIFFMTTEMEASGAGEPLAVLRVKGGGLDGALRTGSAGISVAQFRVSAVQILSTGLQAVRDPGYPFVLIALILVGLGTTLTFAQKLKDLLKEEQA